MDSCHSSVCLFSTMRSGGDRLKNKMARTIQTPNGHLSLGEHNCLRIFNWAEELGCGALLLIPPKPNNQRHPFLSDSIYARLTDRARQSHNHRLVFRSPESEESEHFIGVCRDVPPYLDDFTHSVWINSCCPFLTADIILGFLDGASRLPQGNWHIQAATPHHGFVFADNKGLLEKVYPSREVAEIDLNTKTNPPFYVTYHGLRWSPAKSVGRKELTFRHVVPLQSTWQLFDIDTPDNYFVAQTLATRHWGVSITE